MPCERRHMMTKTDLYTLIENVQPNICQIAAYRGGKKVYSDEWNRYKPDDCTHVMSATKSIVALLIGIAIDQGLIKSIDDKVLAYFPDYSVKRGEKTIYDITIKHLLTMRAPYKCKGDPWTKVCTSEDWTKASLDFLGGRKGLTNEFNYQTVCLHILTGLLYQASKMATVDYANKYLFEPIRIKNRTHYYAKTAEEHKHFTLCKEPKEGVWFGDPMQIATPGYGLCLSAEDKVLDVLIEQAMKQVDAAKEIPGFHMIEKLGSGGMGHVWLVEETKTGQRMALKLMRAWETANETQQDLFLREAHYACQLDHKNIVRHYECGQSGDK